MNIEDTIVPKSDQVQADDLITGPRTVTVESISKGSAEQPVNIHLVEFPGRPFRPSKTVRRLIIAAWGAETSTYIGRRMTIYRDPTVKFGGQEVGGVRVSHLSHIDKRMTLALTVTRGRRAPYVVDPLPDGPAVITDAQAEEIAAEIEQAADRATLNAIGAQLKTLDLGRHRTRLVQLWKERANAVSDEGKAPPQDDVQDASVDAEPVDAPASYYEASNDDGIFPPDPDA